MTQEQFMNQLLQNLELPFSIEDVEGIDSNPGSCHIELKNGDTYFIMCDKCEPDEDEKEFFWKDKSGRGFTNTFTLEDFRQEDAWDDETNDDGVDVKSWAEGAEVGDVWRNDTNEITRTK